MNPRVRAPFQFPQYSRGERRADFAVHATGLVLAAAGAPVLMVVCVDGSDASAAVGLSLYVAGLVAMLAFSASYNVASNHGRKEVLRRFDRAAIYVMIAGTYSPFALEKIGSAGGIGLFAALWCLAIVGAALAFFAPRRSDRVALVMYLAMGWSVVVAVGPLVDALPTKILVLLAAGGVVYTLGVGLHLARRMPYHNAAWHGCVLAAAACHYVAILDTFAVA